MSAISCQIIIPFYKQIAYLEKLVSNLKSCYNVYKDQVELSVIIVNDSPELNLLLCGFLQADRLNFACKIIQHPKNLGVAVARETALKEATAEWIMLLDQDDALDVNVFDVLIKAHKANYDFALMNGYLIHTEPALKFPFYYFEPKLSLKHLVEDDFIRSPGQVFFKRYLLEQIQFPKPVLNKGCDDRFLWILLFLLNPNIRAKYFANRFYIGYIHGENAGLDATKLYACSQELWEQLRQYDFGSNQKYVKKNEQVIAYILGIDSSLQARLAYWQYKYKPNRLLRFVVKNVSRWIKCY